MEFLTASSTQPWLDLMVPEKVVVDETNFFDVVDETLAQDVDDISSLFSQLDEESDKDLLFSNIEEEEQVSSSCSSDEEEEDEDVDLNCSANMVIINNRKRLVAPFQLPYQGGCSVNQKCSKKQIDFRIPFCVIPNVEKKIVDVSPSVFVPPTMPKVNPFVENKQSSQDSAVFSGKKNLPALSYEICGNCRVCKKESYSLAFKLKYHKYLAKRSRRNWTKGPRYKGRSGVATSRTRSNGRFVNVSW